MRKEKTMGKKLYVGGLPYSITEEMLSEAFSKVGPVDSSSVITDRDTGRAKGFGFVEMANEADALKAIQMLHNSVMDGRTIIVNEARPKTDRPSGDRNYSRR